MKLFDVYPLYDIEPVKGEGHYIYDTNGTKYLDLYGGHAVVSIGHSHPQYVKAIQEQASKLVFYSNSIINRLQTDLAEKLETVSGCTDYQLFLCNSGAEANENALKLASFHNGGKRIIAFKNGFHGRTSLAVACTDNPNIVAPVNETENISFCQLGDLDAVEKELKQTDVAAVIVEGILGIGGIEVPSAEFLKGLRNLCNQYGVVLILDEIQSGYGRSGKFFAYQHADIQPDIISMAKGMGNGFPVGGILIKNEIPPKYGLLGTTFGGNHLACAACIAVLEVLEQENMMQNATEVSDYLMAQLSKIPEIESVHGKGLMVGAVFNQTVAPIRKSLLFDHKVFTGAAKNPNMLRILPPLSIGKAEVDTFITALKSVLN